MADPLISVIVPCYNGSAFLAACVQSIVAQRVSCEIIIVDDGSSDDSCDRVIALMREFPGLILLIVQENQGPATARNTGLRAARGQFVCFLDMDDEYLPGFFSTALELFSTNPSAVGVFCGIALVNAHRPVERWHIEVTEYNLPSNVIVKTQTARLLGGFPSDPAFRGKSAGEDSLFREQLAFIGPVIKVAGPFLNYRVRPGSHFDHFLDRAARHDGKLQLNYLSKEETDGSLRRATLGYRDGVRERIFAHLVQTLQTAVTESLGFERHYDRIAALPGTLHPLDGLVLYWLARNWAVAGEVVAVGSSSPRPLAWLAAAMKDLGNGKLTIVNHGMSAARSDPNKSQSFDLQQIIDALDLSSAAEVCTAADPRSVRSRLTEPVRLLLIDASSSNVEAANDFDFWSPVVAKHGLVIFHNLSDAPGAVDPLPPTCGDGELWQMLFRVYTIQAIKKVRVKKSSDARANLP